LPDSALIREIFSGPARSSQSLGMEILSLDMKALETHVRFDGRADFANPAGYVQGGFLVAMMDDAIGMLATIYAQTKTGGAKFPSTVDVHTHFLRPVRTGAIEVAARIRNVGRAMLFCDAQLFDLRQKEAARATASLTLNPVKVPARNADDKESPHD
jgi:uncharacterized protein (TIGR00369 family)